MALCGVHSECQHCPACWQAAGISNFKVVTRDRQLNKFTFSSRRTRSGRGPLSDYSWTSALSPGCDGLSSALFLYRRLIFSGCLGDEMKTPRSTHEQLFFTGRTMMKCDLTWECSSLNMEISQNPFRKTELYGLNTTAIHFLCLVL